MKIALLCPGPSLIERFDQKGGFERVVAVNTAAWIYAVDWLAFSDRHIIEPIREGLYPWPRCGVVTSGAHPLRDGTTRRPLPLADAKSPHITPAMRALAESQATTECAWTFPNALHFAIGLAGPDGEVHVYGFDATNDATDVAGQAGYHTAKRWALEIPWVRLVWDDRCHHHGRAVFP